MEVDDRPGLLAGGEERIPVPGVQRRESQSLGILGEGDRPEAARRVPTDLVGGDGRIGQPGHLLGDKAIRCDGGPFLGGLLCVTNHAANFGIENLRASARQ